MVKLVVVVVVELVFVFEVVVVVEVGVVVDVVIVKVGVVVNVGVVDIIVVVVVFVVAKYMENHDDVVKSLNVCTAYQLIAEGYSITSNNPSSFYFSEKW